MSCSVIDVKVDTYPIGVPGGTKYCEITHACVGPYGSFEITCPGEMLCWTQKWYMVFDTTYECSSGRKTANLCSAVNHCK